MDTFLEQFLPTTEDGKYKGLKGAFFAGIVITLLLFMIYPIIAIPFAAITGGIFFLKKKAYVEFEYELTGSEFDISAIYERSKRKKLASFDVKSAVIIAPKSNSDLKSEVGNSKGEILYTNMNKESEIFGVVINQNGAKKVYYIAPNEEFLDACFRRNPRAVKKY